MFRTLKWWHMEIRLKKYNRKSENIRQNAPQNKIANQKMYESESAYFIDCELSKF